MVDGEARNERRVWPRQRVLSGNAYQMNRTLAA